MNALILRARENPVFANLFACFLIIVGLTAFQTITVKLFPEIDLEAIAVTVPYPGASPEEVEDAIILPIEQKLEGLEGIRKITAVASENIASLVIELEAGEDKNTRLNDIQNEIDQITVFPQQAERPIIAIAEPDELAVQYLFTGSASAQELKRQADKMREALIDAQGVSDVRIEAAPEYLIDIAVSENTLRAYNLSLPQLAGIISRESLDLSGGEIENDTKRVLVRTIGESKVGDDFERLPVVTGENGKVVRLGDIARVNDSLSESPLAGYYDGDAAVVLSVYRVGDEQIFNLVDQADRVFTERVEPNLPNDIAAFLWRDESKNLRSRIDLLISNAIIGVFLVSILLLLFIDLRVAMWVVFGVAVSFVGSFILLSFTGYTINQLSLFGFILAIGIVVDDAIVVGENIYAKTEQGLPPDKAASEGVGQVSVSVLVASLTTIAVFLPLLFIPGIYGQFMGPIAAVVIFVLILSLLESFFILPRHLSHLSSDAPRKYSPRRLTEPARNWMSGKLDWLVNNPIDKGVSITLRHPILTVLAFVAAFMLSLGLIFSGVVKFVFFPEIEGNYVTANVELANRTSDTRTKEVIERIELAAKQAAGTFSASKKNNSGSVINGIFSTRGTQIGGGSPEASAQTSAASNIAYVTVKIEDAATRTFAAVDFERAWREKTGEIAGAKKLAFSSNLVSAGAAVQLEIKARDESRAREVAQKLRDKLSQQPGIIDIQDDRFNTSEELQIRLKPEAANYGVSLAILAQEIRASYFGAEAVRVQRDREEIEVRVRFTEQERASIQSLKDRRIAVNGVFIPISAVADISVGESPASISRKNGQRIITLSADVDTRITTGGSVTSAMLNNAWASIKNEYPSVSVGVGGDQEAQSRAGPAIARNFGISLFVVFALLALVFKSYMQPVVIMAIIPFGFMGALLGHAITGFDLTLLSMFGVIGLSGVVINDSLLLVKFINEEIENGKDIADAVKAATLQRFRPIILTSLTTFFGVTPIILEQSVQAQFLAPTAVSLGIGILFATVVLIFLLPSVAILQLKLSKKLKSKFLN